MVRRLAIELDGSLKGARLRALRFDGRTRDAFLFFRDRTLVWRLHPERLGVRLHSVVEPDAKDHRLRARVRDVFAPPDERILLFELVPERTGPVATFIVELLGTQLNAYLTEGSSHTIRHVLVSRHGKRPAHVGHVWSPPTPTARAGADGAITREEWDAIVEASPPPLRARELVRQIAWTSPISSEALQDSTGHARWLEWTDWGAPPDPTIVDLPHGPQPYPFPLPGFPGTPAPTLIEAIKAVVELGAGESDGAEPASLGLAPGLLARLEDAVERAERRTVRLIAQRDAQADPTALRAVGDLILARYREIPPGVSEVELQDFAGDFVRVQLDPSKAPHDNAEGYYAEASRSERAAVRLPALIASARAEALALARLLAAARTGESSAEEVEAALPRRTTVQRSDAPAALPYHSYRTSGGLDIRVGRGARHNDDLTFRHSAPGDIWLHARHAAGAHVILRWSGQGNPPAKDLHEAGTLAALHSKARHSGSVPVDWTERKYVRKPRKSPPGSVVPERVRTIFVEPDEAVAQRLRVDDG